MVLDPGGTKNGMRFTGRYGPPMTDRRRHCKKRFLSFFLLVGHCWNIAGLGRARAHSICELVKSVALMKLHCRQSRELDALQEMSLCLLNFLRISSDIL